MKLVYFRFPTTREIAEATRHYKAVLADLEAREVPAKNRLMLQLNKYDLYTFSMEQEIERIENLSKFKYRKPYIDKTKEEINKLIDQDITEIIVGERIIDLKAYVTEDPGNPVVDNDFKRYGELCSTRDAYLKYSRENIAEQQRSMKLAQLCSYNGDNSRRIWETWDVFCGERNRAFQITIMNLCSSFLSGVPQNKIRKIARHPIWRSKWISATKTGSPLFEGPVASWDTNKTFLSYWSNFYDNIYSAHEPPDDFVVEDDELLDGWLEKRSREMKSGGSGDNSTKEGTVGIFRNRINPVPKKR